MILWYHKQMITCHAPFHYCCASIFHVPMHHLNLMRLLLYPGCIAFGCLNPFFVLIFINYSLPVKPYYYLIIQCCLNDQKNDLMRLFMTQACLYIIVFFTNFNNLCGQNCIMIGFTVLIWLLVKLLSLAELVTFLI